MISDSDIRVRKAATNILATLDSAALENDVFRNAILDNTLCAHDTLDRFRASLVRAKNTGEAIDPAVFDSMSSLSEGLRGLDVSADKSGPATIIANIFDSTIHAIRLSGLSATTISAGRTV